MQYRSSSPGRRGPGGHVVGVVRVHVDASSVSKILSSIVAALYVVGASWEGGAHLAARALLFLVMPLACIWFSEAMGDHTGVTSRGYLRASPASFVHVAGWLLLLSPLGVAVVQAAVH